MMFNRNLKIIYSINIVLNSVYRRINFLILVKCHINKNKNWGSPAIVTDTF